MSAGVARLALRQGATTVADRATRKKTRIVFYLAGGPQALSDFRDKVRKNGLEPGEFVDEGSLRTFALEDPDGYQLGFVTNIR